MADMCHLFFACLRVSLSGCTTFCHLVFVTWFLKSRFRLAVVDGVGRCFDIHNQPIKPSDTEISKISRGLRSHLIFMPLLRLSR